MVGTPWSKDEEKILKKMAEKGCKDREIALVLRLRTINGIRAKRGELNLQERYFLPKAEIDMETFNRFMKGER
jgi:hypothetical protein